MRARGFGFEDSVFDAGLEYLLALHGDSKWVGHRKRKGPLS